MGWNGRVWGFADASSSFGSAARLSGLIATFVIAVVIAVVFSRNAGLMDGLPPSLPRSRSETFFDVQSSRLLLTFAVVVVWNDCVLFPIG